MLFGKLLTHKKFLTIMTAIGLSGLLVLPSAQAGVDYHHWHPHHHRHWHGHYHRGGFGPGLFFGTAFGFLAGAAMAGHEGYQCRQTVVNCSTHYGYYGPYRSCYRTVRWVC